MVKKGLLPLLIISGISLPVLQAQSLQKADSLAELGARLNNEARYNKAEVLLEQALDIYKARNDTARWIRYALEYGEALVDQAKFNPGLEIFHHLSSINHPSLTISFKARIENDLGWTYERLEQFDEAVIHYRNSWIQSRIAKDSTQMGIVTSNLANIFRIKGNYTEALKYGREAIELYESYSTRFSMAIRFNNIGVTYKTLSMYEHAEKYYQKSIQIREDLGNPDLLATGYNNLAVLNENSGNLDRALVYYEKSLGYRRETGNPSKTSVTLANIGSLYRRLGDMDKALSYYREALELNRQYNGPKRTSATLTKLGHLHRDRRELQKAREYYLEALELRREFENPHLIANTYLDLAAVEQDLDNRPAARHYLESALAIAGQADVISLKLRSYSHKGAFYRRAGKPDSSLAACRQAYRLSRSLTPYQQLWPSVRMAYAFRLSGSDSAFYYGEQAIAIMEEFRTRAGFLSILKTGFFKDFTSFYEDLAAWYAQDKRDYNRAFYLVEASRARSFADELAMASANLDAGLPEEVRVSVHEKSQKIEELFARLQEQTDTGTKEELEKQLRKAELDYAAYMNQIREDYPQFKQIAYPSPISLSSAQALADENTAFLEYAIAGDGLLIFLIAADKIQVQKVDISEGSDDPQQMTKLVEDFRDKILAHAPVSEIKAQGALLTNLLISPFYDQLSSYSGITIIPDGVLAYLPFEALPADNRYLIEKFNIKYAPSLTTFSLLNKLQSNFEMDLLAVAGSNFPGSLSEPLSRGRSYQPLPATLTEVDSIASKFERVSIFKKGDFSENFIKQKLGGNFRFIHLATHGVIDEDHPDRSGLVLSASARSQLSGMDGMLRSSEIYQLRMHCNMVVLSACNTGLGKMVKGEGMLSLQRSFFYAGVPTVTVSLWSVYDRSTAFLMDEFYTSVLSRDQSAPNESLWTTFLRWIGWDESVPYGNTAPAMRTAKLKMLEHPLFHHPVYWAPFIVVGR